MVSVDSGGFCWAVQIEDLFEQTFQWMSVQMKYVCRPRVKPDIYWENFIWSLNEANHILDFSKLFSKELVFISPGVLISFIHHVICYLWSGRGFFILFNSNSIIEKL